VRGPFIGEDQLTADLKLIDAVTDNWLSVVSYHAAWLL
jgi:hypothetical protein